MGAKKSVASTIRLHNRGVPVKSFPLGLCLHTVRNEWAADAEGTLRAVAKIGYRAVEPGLLTPCGMPPATFKKLLHELGLVVFAAHATMDHLQNQLDEVIHCSAILGNPFVICPNIRRDEFRSSAAGWRNGAKALSDIGGRLRKEGLQLCYHNHDFEFQVFDGRSGYEWFVDAVSPDDVKLQVDVYWAKKGGHDPVQWINLLGSRCPLLHLKDMGPDGDFTEVGNGSVDFPGILKAARKTGVRGFSVEQDRCARPPLESSAISFEAMRRLAPDLV